MKFSEFKKKISDAVYFEPNFEFDEDDWVSLYEDFKESVLDIDQWIQYQFETNINEEYTDYWLKSDKVSGYNIQELHPDQVFVFGSNMKGIHGAGAAKLALVFGAEMGKWSGYYINTYAIPTKDRGIQTLDISDIKPYVDRFIKFAATKKKKIFLVTEIGCGLANYDVIDIAPLFEDALNVDNIWLPYRFKKYLIKNLNNEKK